MFGHKALRRGACSSRIDLIHEDIGAGIHQMAGDCVANALARAGDDG